ncbi:pH nine-sensitive protein 1 [Maublancomyces gigas]|uniref:PH nine-sensitive protein 1 n=1 Tax=Discina gigas TaxID=1032678 RepID=A0ABR3G4S9_9PEZI
MAFAFLVGLQIYNIFMVPVKSGVATIFTCMAHNPEILMRDFPELYHQILAVYPELSNAIHS